MVYVIVLVVLLSLVSAGIWKYAISSSATSRETVILDDRRRNVLVTLMDEKKFEPHDYAPLGYTGAATLEEGDIARSAVNSVIKSIIARENGPITARTVSSLIGQGMKRVSQLETEDRERTAGYMIEIWYLLGFKGPIGRFAYGSAFQRPNGYAEPLPPGWKSPTEPRLSTFRLSSRT